MTNALVKSVTALPIVLVHYTFTVANVICILFSSDRDYSLFSIIVIIIIYFIFIIFIYY
jgi:phosphate starvation-inducible membrane PsiE